jgi:hypothetical protein
MTVAERHGYGRAAQSSRPVAPPPPPAGSVRPAPKPSGPAHAQPKNGRPVARVGANGSRNGNGHSYHSLDEEDF